LLGFPSAFSRSSEPPPVSLLEAIITPTVPANLAPDVLNPPPFPRAANKGSAFVKYSKRSEAIAAIDALNGKTPMEGQASPLVVKFADPPRERNMNNQGMGGGMGGFGGCAMMVLKNASTNLLISTHQTIHGSMKF
jgi:hypothetical protein